MNRSLDWKFTSTEKYWCSTDCRSYGAEIKIKELLRLGEGSVVELDRLAGDPLDILANGTMIAKGEVVMVGERYGVRFIEIVDPEKRMESIICHFFDFLYKFNLQIFLTSHFSYKRTIIYNLAYFLPSYL